MKPSIIRTGLCGAVTAAVVVTLSGLAPAAIADPASPDMSTKLAGKTIFLDPGHQGPEHAENLAKQVSDGRGGTKDCQTTGMITVNGVQEHTINWKVAELVRATVEDLGAKVVLSRPDDSGWGGCVDERAQAANNSGADVAVSIHADSAPAQYRGFHLIVPQLPILDTKADQVQSGSGLAATKAVRDAYLQAGFPAANYAGAQDGLQTRSDVAGPALTTVPDVFVEMGNGANNEDAALLESQEGQVKHALAIATGLIGFLLGNPQQATTPEAAGTAPASAGSAQAGSAADQPASAPASSAPQAQAVPQAQAAPGAPAAPHVPALPAAAPQQAAVSEPATVPQSTAPAGTVPHSPAALDPPPGYAQAPGYAQLPGSQSPNTAPGSQQSPTAPQADWQQSPGYALSPNTPQSPGTAQTPGSQLSPGQSTPSTTSSLPVLVGTIMQMLMPLAQSLGMDNTVLTSELINLAYTLASTLLGPVK
ncbi:N-acetylmuramoyl-L-alanine amidase [Nocardia sp. NBC_00565]|uniref:N-acetylmuramoyl-L-alanine amidase n=1 Tax=Nocardia sp. NBC_00565 TaxID=2975993 RepID=UPI002E81A396|nr:N-acetylmuramoyl-L-alanine amidase [Nocardia sp. NBC_00565]WUC00223.1 N-acetylmuramoyl-L-alanine amidase [Nocardia sp. NBC_00565]